MSELLNNMRLALRVLAAIDEKRRPNAADIHKLRQLLPVGPRLAPEELACQVIQQALNNRPPPSRQQPLAARQSA